MFLESYMYVAVLAYQPAESVLGSEGSYCSVVFAPDPPCTFVSAARVWGRD